jgi:hypothetical protein
MLADEVLRIDMVTNGKVMAPTILMHKHLKEIEQKGYSFIQKQWKTFSGMEDKCLVTLSAQ